MGHVECPWLAGSELNTRIKTVSRNARLFFIGNSITRELMFETYARLTDTQMNGDVYGRKYSCGNPSDLRDKFPNCRLLANTTNTTLGFHWYQHYVQHEREGYLEACANVQPNGALTCFSRLFGSQPSAKDFAIFLLNICDAGDHTSPSLEDRLFFVQALSQTFSGTSVLIIPCLYNMQSVNVPGPETNVLLTKLNNDTVHQLRGRIRMVELQDICDENHREYYDALHQHPRVSGLIMDRVWNVLLRAMEERK